MYLRLPTICCFIFRWGQIEDHRPGTRQYKGINLSRVLTRAGCGRSGGRTGCSGDWRGDRIGWSWSVRHRCSAGFRQRVFHARNAWIQKCQSSVWSLIQHVLHQIFSNIKNCPSKDKSDSCFVLTGASISHGQPSSPTIYVNGMVLNQGLAIIPSLTVT